MAKRGFLGVSSNCAIGWRTAALFVLLLFFFILFPCHVKAAEFQSRYATIHYENDQQVRKLNNELFLSRNLGYRLRERKLITVQDEVGAKIDLLIEQVQVVLEMFPERIKFDLFLFDNAAEAQKELFRRYGKKVDFISFYSRRENALYLSARDGELKVVAHELAHVVLEHYFKPSPPVKVHEVLAQYAAGHIAD
ncbi:MAG: hypothetical protein KJ950_01700 [Proteobacteria bacterium]|nr:hypothetical protein [Pseudomonadota bacterium]MBU1688213.1 hypothetical protein [Pseudomonadota bacterium]